MVPKYLKPVIKFTSIQVQKPPPQNKSKIFLNHKSLSNINNFTIFCCQFDNTQIAELGSGWDFFSGSQIECDRPLNSKRE